MAQIANTAERGHLSKKNVSTAVYSISILFGYDKIKCEKDVTAQQAIFIAVEKKISNYKIVVLIAHVV